MSDTSHHHLARYRMLGYFRQPHTQSERRQNFVMVDDNDNLTAHQVAHILRAKRKHIPTAYDDKPVSLWKQAQFVNRWRANRQQYRRSHFDS